MEKQENNSPLTKFFVGVDNEKMIEINNQYHLIKKLNPKLELTGELAMKMALFHKTGLSLNPHMQHIYWITFGGSVAGVVSPKGWITLLNRIGLMATINVVYEGDNIEIDLGSNSVKHNPTGQSTQIVGAYCLIRDTQGNVLQLEYLRKHEIDAIKSKSRGGSVWKDFEGEMVRKSVLKRCIKKIAIDDAKFCELVESDKNDFDFTPKKEINNGQVDQKASQIYNMEVADEN